VPTLRVRAAPKSLLRVSRGLYKLNPSAVDRPSVRPFVRPPTRETPDPARTTQPATTTERAWHWEGNIQASVVSHLAMSGWSSTRVADTSSKEHGYDIDARRDGARIIVEVKGYPSTIRSRGDGAGEAKSPGALASQARSYVGGAVLTGILMRAENPEARVVIAFPSVTTFMNLATRIRDGLAKIGVELWTIAEDRTVTELVEPKPETAADERPSPAASQQEGDPPVDSELAEPSDGGSALGR
jgi:hypothetical protein